MYCPYCHADVGENTTICHNCGKKFYIEKSDDYCTHCGYTGPLIRKVKSSIGFSDWMQLLFFPFTGLVNFITKIKYRPKKVVYKCPRCGIVEERDI